MNARLGPVWGTDIWRHSLLVKNAYGPLLASAPRDGIEIIRDVPYADHARHVVDIFRPVGLQSAPVVVFVHGGAFIRGDKRTDDQIYDNVLLWFARQGFVGVNVEYRLAPDAGYPAGAEDIGTAMAWLAAHVEDHGGDPDRMLLIGHSAGGTHAAGYVFDPSLAHLERHAAALVLISARLRADRLDENPNAAGVTAYFGDDVSLDDGRSPVSHAALGETPTFVVIAEFENPLLDVYGLEFAHRLAVARRVAPPVMQMKGHNHMSIVAHFNSGEDTLGREIIEFFDAAVRRREVTGKA